MNYEEAIDYLYNRIPMFQQVGSKAYKEGMENTLSIDSHLNHPHLYYLTIHVAGTNGKGSTSHLIASILQQAGYKVGLYTSPHLTDFRERIRVNGTMISPDYVAAFMTENVHFFEPLQPSFFELTTGMAFAYFAYEQVNVAVIEVGLGGRLDCTNVIRPDLSIITNISLDHTALLGNTVEEIAREKAGIIKQGIPVVIGEASGKVKDVFLNKYKEVNEVSRDINEDPTMQNILPLPPPEGDSLRPLSAELSSVPYPPLEGAGGGYSKLPTPQKPSILFAEEEKPIRSATLLPSGQWQFDATDYPELIGELGGFAQEKNAATVLCAIKELKQTGYQIPDSAVYEGFRKVVETTGLLGRWQVIQTHPKIVLDTGHNIGGMEYIVRQLKAQKYNHLHIVIGMVNDKDVSGVLQLLPKDAIYYFTKASIPRALDEKELAEKGQMFRLSGKTYPNVKEAYLHAKSAARPNDLLFVGGSTFIVADALSAINNTIDSIP